MKKYCRNCGKDTVKKRCSKCKFAHYCDATCQIAHYRYHKNFCIGERDQIPESDTSTWWCEEINDDKFPSAELCANFLPDVSQAR
jgi:sulfatase maturation enzyme AslB (radical SAM superfamily)